MRIGLHLRLLARIKLYVLLDKEKNKLLNVFKNLFHCEKVKIGKKHNNYIGMELFSIEMVFLVFL